MRIKCGDPPYRAPRQALNAHSNQFSHRFSFSWSFRGKIKLTLLSHFTQSELQKLNEGIFEFIVMYSNSMPQNRNRFTWYIVLIGSIFWGISLQASYWFNINFKILIHFGSLLFEFQWQLQGNSEQEFKYVFSL